jgi:hypothetical protein
MAAPFRGVRPKDGCTAADPTADADFFDESFRGRRAGVEPGISEFADVRLQI